MRRLLMATSAAALLALLAGCGGSGQSGPAAEATSATPATAATTPPPATSAPTATTVFDPSCRPELQPLADALSELDSRLSVGMNFEVYSQRVGDVRVAYDKVDFAALDEACIGGPGVQLEKAVNSYQRAYRVWNTCIEDIDCSNDSIDSLLQQHWSRATRQVSNAQTMLEFG